MAKRTSKIALGALIAGAAGYAAGVLTAPKSGKEMRRDVKDVAVFGLREAEKQLKKLHTELHELLASDSLQLSALEGKARRELEQVVQKAREVKERARIALSSVHEGETDDKDLQLAIEDANRAIENLRRFAP